MTSGTEGGVIDELRVLVIPAVRGMAWRLPEIVVALAVLVTVIAGFALAGAALDDRAIAANPAIAQADVLEGSTASRTLVRFTVADGQSVVPEGGVFYPAGLVPGSSVAVEYDVTAPDLVRVAGRSALNGVLPLGVAVLVTWLVLGPLAWWLHRRRPRESVRNGA